jgi:hypothetical protein
MNTTEDDRLEAEPLLSGEERDSIEIDATPPEPENNNGHTSRKHGQRRGFAARFQAQKRSTIVLLLAVLMFTLTTSGMLILIPIFRLMEDAICHGHYGRPMAEPIDERLCKVEAVQKELAYLGGASAMIHSIVGVVSVLPYGVFADR